MVAILACSRRERTTSTLKMAVEEVAGAEAMVVNTVHKYVQICAHRFYIYILAAKCWANP